MRQPLVSVIIPAYNEADIVHRAIDSAKRQSWKELELIVVDDGSTDGTADRVRSRYPDVTLVVQENTGLPGARNAGVRAASGEYLAFLDADDEWRRDKTKLQMRVLLDNPSDVVACNAVKRRGSRDFHYNDIRRPRISEVSMLELLDHPPYQRPAGAGYMCTREVFDSVGGYDSEQRWMEDVDMYCRLLSSGHRILLLNEPLYVFYRDQAGRITDNDIEQTISWTLRYIKRWDPRRSGSASNLTLEQYASVIGGVVLRAACVAARRSKYDLAQELISELDAIPLPARYRNQIWLSERSWRLFCAAAGTDTKLRWLGGIWAGRGPRGILDRLVRKTMTLPQIVPPGET